MSNRPLYPWQEEFFAWSRAQAKKIGDAKLMSHAEWERKYPPTKVSRLIEVTSEILKQGEITEQWTVVEEAQNKTGADHFVMWEDEEYKYFCNLVGDYAKWLRMKSGVEDHPSAYSVLPALVREIRLGNVPAEDRGAALREYILRSMSSYIVDDLGMTDDEPIPSIQYPHPTSGYDWQLQPHEIPLARGGSIPAETLLQVAKAAFKVTEIVENISAEIEYWKNHGRDDENGFPIEPPMGGFYMVKAFYASYLVRHNLRDQFGRYATPDIIKLLKAWISGETSKDDDAVSLSVLRKGLAGGGDDRD